MSKPWLAESEVETATTSGMARPRAWGQVMTITVTMRPRAKLKSLPAPSQMASVSPPADSAMTVSHSAAPFARSCDRDRDSCALAYELDHL